MQTGEPLSEARVRVLNTAERLFSERGYTSVTLRDIADALGMKQASLYNHAPGGKQELYMAVMERAMERHRAQLRAVAAAAGPNLRAQLRAMARWLLSQPPINLTRLASTDLPALEAAHAAELTRQSGTAIFEPVIQAIDQAYRRSEIRLVEPALLASMFLVIIDSLHYGEQYSSTPKAVMADDMIDILLDGVLRR